LRHGRDGDLTTRWIVGVRFRLTPYDLLCYHVGEYELYIDNSLNNKYNIYIYVTQKFDILHPFPFTYHVDAAQPRTSIALEPLFGSRSVSRLDGYACIIHGRAAAAAAASWYLESFRSGRHEPCRLPTQAKRCNAWESLCRKH
jgi:hypothetical protein